MFMTFETKTMVWLVAPLHKLHTGFDLMSLFFEFFLKGQKEIILFSISQEKTQRLDQIYPLQIHVFLLCSPSHSPSGLCCFISRNVMAYFVIRCVGKFSPYWMGNSWQTKILKSFINKLHFHVKSLLPKWHKYLCYAWDNAVVLALMRAIKTRHIWCYYGAHFLWACSPVATSSVQKWLIFKNRLIECLYTDNEFLWWDVLIYCLFI